MSRLINQHIDKILETIPEVHITEYDWLVGNVHQVGEGEYQRRYKAYWALNAALLSKDYCKEYFKCLIVGLKKVAPKIGELVINLYDVPTHRNGRKSLQFSFCSKLCHMLNNDLPLYDSKIRDFYFFSLPDASLPHEEKVKEFVVFYEFLTREYGRILNHGLLDSSISAFRERFKPGHFSDIKVIDSLIWSFTYELKAKNLIHSTFRYD